MNQESEFTTKPKRRSAIYMIFLVFFLILYDAFDTYTEQAIKSVISYIKLDFSISDSQWYTILAIASIGLFAVIGIQYLTDIVGRKPMIIVVFFGMGLASLLTSLSRTAAQFTIAYFLLWMFFSSDIWIIIMAEEAPEAHRGRLMILIPWVGVFGFLIPPIIRTALITTPDTWRMINIVAYLAMPVALLGFFLKETPIFMENKSIIRESGRKKFSSKVLVSTLTTPFSSAYRMKTVVFILLGFTQGIYFAGTTTIEVFLTYHIQDPDTVSTVYLIATGGILILMLIVGFLVDITGRKKMFFILFGVNIIGNVAFVYLTPFFMSISQPYLIAPFALLAVGSFGVGYLITKNFCSESFPSQIRGTSTGLRAFSYALGTTLGAFLFSGLAIILSLGTIYLICSIIVALTIPLVAKFLPETKGIKLK